MTDGETYRAELDSSYIRYERITNADGSTRMWRAQSLDGRTLYFGENDSSRDLPNQASPPGAVESRWFLTRVTDAFGNEIRYSYTKDFELLRDGTLLAPVDIYPNSVEWGGNPGAGLSSNARVVFLFAARDLCAGSSVPIGALLSYRTGVPLMPGARRLTTARIEINSAGSWRERGRYQLGYDMTELACPTGLTHAPLRLLTSLQETATAPDGVVSTLPASPRSSTDGASSRSPPACR